MKIRTKPVKPKHFEGIIWNGKNGDEVFVFVGEKFKSEFSLVDKQLRFHERDKSYYVVPAGFWIMKELDRQQFTVAERLWFCSPEVFAKNYEVCD